MSNKIINIVALNGSASALASAHSLVLVSDARARARGAHFDRFPKNRENWFSFIHSLPLARSCHCCEVPPIQEQKKRKTRTGPRVRPQLITCIGSKLTLILIESISHAFFDTLLSSSARASLALRMMIFFFVCCSFCLLLLYYLPWCVLAFCSHSARARADIVHLDVAARVCHSRSHMH